MLLSKKRASEVCRRGLFRAATGLAVLSRGGRVWSADEAKEAIQETQQVKQVDVFVSHSWSADRWEKHLAMCFYLNLWMASKALTVSAVVSQFVVAFLPEQSIDMTYMILMDLPVLIFLTFFFFGQHLTCGCLCPSIWVDKMCVDQTNESTKWQGIAELPAIVACSDQLLVLWSESYFERLWCNFELSIFVKLCGVGKIRCVPLWMAPWLLVTIALSWFGSRMDSIVLDSDPEAFTVMLSYGAQDDALEYAMSRTMEYVAEAPFFAVTLLPNLIVSAISFRMKLERHETMLKHMETFDIRAAKCSLEEDRDYIEQRVAELFDGIDDPTISVALDSAEWGAGGPSEMVTETETTITVPHDSRPAIRAVTSYLGHEDSLDAFNTFVRHQLRSVITADLGLETDFPYIVSLISFFPAFLDFTAQSWCGRAFRDKAGFASDGQYFALSFVTAFLALFVNFPLSPPCFLLVMKWIVARTSPGFLRHLLALTCGFVLNMALCAMYGSMIGMLESFAITGHLELLAYFLLMLSIHLFCNYALYGHDFLIFRRLRPSHRGLRREEGDSLM
ncbi:unnamed protein product [Symbiodinium microadriaticum]|nr:unnamed protein product [Symbiodinium microadriaticum]